MKYILGVEINGRTNEPYISKQYSWEVGGTAPEREKALKKANLIFDSGLRMEELRRITSTNYRENNRPLKIEFEKYGFETLDEFFEASKEHLFFGIWTALSDKHYAEIEYYTKKILEASNNKAKNNIYEALCFLVDEQYKRHTDVIDDVRTDYAMQNQYNALIFDVLENEINRLYTINYQPYEPKDITKKPLMWNGKKQIIGTLFGLLKSKGLISGTNADMAKGLNILFSNLSENTLLDNINLKINTNEGKNLYDTQTENFINDFLKYATSTIKKGKSK